MSDQNPVEPGPGEAWDRDTTLGTFADESDEQLALMIGIEEGWTGKRFYGTEDTGPIACAIATERPYYLGGLYAGKIAYFIAKLFMRNYGDTLSRTNIPSDGLLDHPSKVHAFMFGIDAGYTGTDYLTSATTTDENLGEINEFIDYYYAARLAGRFARMWT